MAAKLTTKEAAALRTLSEKRNGMAVRWSAAQLGHSASVLGSLYRKGLVRSMTQEERPLHERAIRYQLYEMTDAGRAALSQNQGGTDD